MIDDILYSYAKNTDGVFVHIKDAVKTDYYYLESKDMEKIQMIVVHGEKLQWHFRSKVKADLIGMTAQHINLQAFICNSLEFYSHEFKCTITAKKSKSEYRLNNNRIVDVAYFDDNNDFLCGIEVVHTNDISVDKFKDLYESDYLIFKVHTHDPKRFIFVNNRKAFDRSIIEAERKIEQYKNKWREEMAETNTGFRKKASEYSGRHIDIEIEYTQVKAEYNRLREKERIIDDEIYRMRNRHNISESYFDSYGLVKNRLEQSDTEEGKLIKDIARITTEINKILLTQ